MGNKTIYIHICDVLNSNGKTRGKIDGRRGKRSKQPLYDLEETRGYWKFKLEVLVRPPWRELVVGETIDLS